jgi:hypothetical protein
MNGMNELVAFLRARLDEDAEIANRWLYEYGDQRSWRVVGGRRLTYGNGCSENVVAIDVDSKVLYHERIYVKSDLDDCTEHIARHDPARVLADVDAKRQIIADCASILSDPPDTWGQGVPVLVLALDTLKNLALPFADHSDYRKEWKP